jgi:hypothetical protein
MSTLGFCELDQAFNSTIKRKKKSSKSRKLDIEDELIQRDDIHVRDVDRPNLSNSLDRETVNALPYTYEQNEQFAKLRQEQKLEQQHNRDEKPNQMQFDMNRKFDEMVRSFESRIVKLEEFYERKIQEILENNRADHKEPRKIEPFTVNKPTFNNDQFNELLLYIFTGIFLLVLIDYIYKLGKKSF